MMYVCDGIPSNFKAYLSLSLNVYASCATHSGITGFLMQVPQEWEDSDLTPLTQMELSP